MGEGGRVKGDKLECPFHLWTFDADTGKAGVPYCATAPDSANAHGYPVREYYGMVLVSGSGSVPRSLGPSTPRLLPLRADVVGCRGCQSWLPPSRLQGRADL